MLGLKVFILLTETNTFLGITKLLKEKLKFSETNLPNIFSYFIWGKIDSLL